MSMMSMSTRANPPSTDLWPHQARAIEEVLHSHEIGIRRICLTAPTGAGKSRIACELIRWFLERDLRVSVYTNRKMLLEQMSRVLGKAGLGHGVRSAGYDSEGHKDVQVTSIQTEWSRTFKREIQSLYPANLVIVDEAHLNKSLMAFQIMKAHLDQGATVLGLTATPLDLGDLYDHLVVAGTVSECRKAGALVLAHHFGPDEPDLRHIGPVRVGEDLTEKQQTKAMMVPGIFGRVWTHWKRLNPDGKPTILFAPSVESSIWFAEQFEEKGVCAVHIDGDNVWRKGRLVKSCRELRQEVLDGSREGRVPVLCNRFVLREGIDCPWLAHGILATVFGSLGTYLQSGGRLLRAYPGVDSVTIQDHGGNWHRHGSLNSDRAWELGMTSAGVTARREDAFRNPPPDEPRPPEPMSCPRCFRVILSVPCPCGWDGHGEIRSRMVVQHDGELIPMDGDIYRPRKVYTRPNGIKRWIAMYNRSKTESGARTFRAAFALFAYENGWCWPNREWPMMPLYPEDVYRLVGDVPRSRLR